MRTELSRSGSPPWFVRANAVAAGWNWHFRMASGRSPSADATGVASGSDPDQRTPRMARVEAVLLVAGSALSFRRLAQLATLADLSEAREIVSRLNESYDRTGSAFRIEMLATGVRLLTRPQFALWLDRVHQRQARLKLSSPMLETLAIVAYRQPVTRAEVEKIRGVQSSDMLKQLMDRGLIRIVGEDESLGRPFLYGTSRQFLEEFGLSSLEEMPAADVLLRKTADVPRPAEAAELRWEGNDTGGESSADDAEAA